MRADSGWNTAEPRPTVAAASRMNRELAGDAQHDQAGEGEEHADRERIRLRLAVGDDADHRLQQRRGELERQRDQADLGEVERVVRLQDRIDRRDQRLHGVVEEVREAQAADHRIGRPARRRLRSRRGRQRRRDDRGGKRFLGDDDGLVHGCCSGVSIIASGRGEAADLASSIRRWLPCGVPQADAARLRRCRLRSR